MANAGYCPKFRAFTAAGEVGAGYLLYFYAAGTSTVKHVYTAYDRLTAATDANGMITLDSAGETTFFWGPGRYKVVLKTPLGNTVWTMDYVTGDTAYIDDSVTPNVLKYNDGSSAVSVDAVYPVTDLDGCVLSVNGSDTDHDIDISAGHRCDSTKSYNMVLGTALTKRLDAAWSVGTNQGGLDTGSLAASACYHVWLIKNPTSGVVDALFSLSSSIPTMPTGYTLKRRLGAVVMSDDVDTVLRSFLQRDTGFYFDTAVEDISLTTTPNGKASYAMSVITGVVAKFFGVAHLVAPAASETIKAYNWPAATTGHPVVSALTAGWGSAYFECLTNTTNQISIYGANKACTAMIIYTLGWDDLDLRNGS